MSKNFAGAVNGKPQRINGSIVTFIVKNYASNGKIKLPNSTGGKAFLKALREKGVRV